MARPSEVQDDLSPASRSWLDATSARDRKALGQYLTPRQLADALVKGLDLEAGKRVLDPGVGTGELLAAAARCQPGLELTGWDIDAAALAAARVNLPDAVLEERSALDPWKGESFDLVVGNPPYFQFRPDPAVKARFTDVISGRPNIFAFFFKVGLEVLRPNGQLAYIVPPSLNSGAYFEALREYVIANAALEGLTVLDGTAHFEGANTAVQILVLRKGPSSDRFLFERQCEGSGFRRVIFTAEPEKLSTGFEGRRTLWELGYEATTGTVVWNQRRDELRKAEGEGTVPLVWSHNLKAGELDLTSRPGKPRFIESVDPMTGPAVLVNRVVGSVGRGELRTALVPEGMEFLAENHVNVVRPRSGVVPEISWQELHELLEDPAAARRIRMLTGNTQISARELTHLLPLG